MNNKLFYFFIILISFLMMGCATAPSAYENIPVIPGQDLHISNKTLKVGNVIGGESTNAFTGSKIDAMSLRSAIVISLDKYKLFNVVETGEDYILDALILSQDQPMMGLDMKVGLLVKYILKNSKGEDIWVEEIHSSYTAAMSEAFVGAIRLDIANKGAIRENVKILLEKLSDLQL